MTRAFPDLALWRSTAEMWKGGVDLSRQNPGLVHSSREQHTQDEQEHHPCFWSTKSYQFRSLKKHRSSPCLLISCPMGWKVSGAACQTVLSFALLTLALLFFASELTLRPVVTLSRSRTGFARSVISESIRIVSIFTWCVNPALRQKSNP